MHTPYLSPAIISVLLLSGLAGGGIALTQLWWLSFALLPGSVIASEYLYETRPATSEVMFFSGFITFAATMGHVGASQLASPLNVLAGVLALAATVFALGRAQHNLTFARACRTA